MKVLLYSPAFHPLIGGLEIVVAILAEELSRRGAEVVVVTRTGGPSDDGSPFTVVRRPGPARLVRLTRWCDVFFQANVSLRGLWPLLLVRRPWVVSHHSWYCRSDGRIAWQDRLKRYLPRYASASIAANTKRRKRQEGSSPRPLPSESPGRHSAHSGSAPASGMRSHGSRFRLLRHGRLFWF